MITRHTDDADEAPESLYYYHGQLYERVVEAATPAPPHPVIVSSERLTDSAGWQPIPPNHMVLLRRGAAPELRAIPVC